MTITKEILEHCIKNLEEDRSVFDGVERIYNGEGAWWATTTRLDDTNSFRYRIKPRTIIVNGIEVPAPLYRIDDETEVYIANPALESYYQTVKVTYEADSFLCEPLERGLVHSQAENAATHGKAMLKYQEV